MDLYIHDYTGHVGQLEVARGLAERGHKVVFSYCSSMPTPRGDMTAADGLSNLSIEAIDIGAAIDKQNHFARQWQDVAYARALKRHIRGRRPEIVLSANNPLVPQWALVRHCRRRSIPLVHWWTDVYSRAVRHGVGRRFGPIGPLAAWSYERLEARLLKQSQAVLAIAEQFRTIAQGWGVSTPLTVIPVAAPTEQIRPGPKRNAWSERHGVAETDNILYCGTLGKKHHPEVLWEQALALKARDNVRVIVAAEGVGADWLRQRQSETPLANLLLLPFQSFADYGQVLAAGDVHVTILSQEASGYALPSKVMSQLCAARAQLAIVPVDNQVAGLIAEAGAGFVCSPEDVDCVLQKTETLLANPQLRERCGASGRRYAEQHLSLGSLLPRYEELIERVIQGGEKRPRS